MPKHVKTHTATIQIIVELADPNEVCDWISGLFEGASTEVPFDWRYVRVNEQYLYPTPLTRPEGWHLEDLS